MFPHAWQTKSFKTDSWIENNFQCAAKTPWTTFRSYRGTIWCAAHFGPAFFSDADRKAPHRSPKVAGLLFDNIGNGVAGSQADIVVTTGFDQGAYDHLGRFER